jgi:AcrR family transcriptional regulator
MIVPVEIWSSCTGLATIYDQFRAVVDDYIAPRAVSEYSLTMLVSGRDRLLAAALKLFAAKGYAATSVADIQRASGLAPGSGALYKHFGSKRQLLEAAVAHRIDTIVAAREQYDAGEPGSVEQAVRTAGQLIWDNLRQSEDVLKVMLREPDELGDLDEMTWRVISDNAYQRFADELSALNRFGRTRIPDPEAAAAVAIASLSYAATLHALTGRSPGNVGHDRYFEAWVNQTLSVIAKYAKPPSLTTDLFQE